MFQYAYFVGGVILAFIWVVFFLLRKDLRTVTIFGGMLSLPFGFTEFLFVPEYWDPPSLFNMIDVLGFGIESLMFAFFTGGIAATVYKVFFGRRIVKVPSLARGFTLYTFSILLFVGLEFAFPTKSIYNMIGTFLLISVFIVLSRRDLFLPVLLSALLFSLVYTMLFTSFRYLFPTYVEQVYSLANFLGMNFFGLPVEEPAFALSVGACWATFYEYTFGYKVVE